MAGQSQTLRELIENHPLTTDDIKLMFNVSDQYVIPYQQTHVRKCALVLYNTEGRPSASQEADDLTQSLATAGFDTRLKEWKRDLDVVVTDALPVIEPAKLSLLVICIMTHGTAGMLMGSNNYTESISDILQHLKDMLPVNLPLVSCLLCEVSRVPTTCENILVLPS